MRIELKNHWVDAGLSKGIVIPNEVPENACWGAKVLAGFVGFDEPAGPHFHAHNIYDIPNPKTKEIVQNGIAIEVPLDYNPKPVNASNSTGTMVIHGNGYPRELKVTVLSNPSSDQTINKINKIASAIFGLQN